MSDRTALVKHKGTVYEAVVASVPFRPKEKRAVLYEVVDGVRVVRGSTQWDVEQSCCIGRCPDDVPASVFKALNTRLAEATPTQ